MINLSDKKQASEFCTALADNEINDSGLKSELIRMIEEDENLAFDYAVQLKVKEAVQNHITPKPAPEELKKKIRIALQTEKSSFFVSLLIRLGLKKLSA